MPDFSIIGKPIAMVDAAGKTTGAGKYTDDLSVPGMLVGKILHSPYPHARIKRIDTSLAEKLEGVVAVAIGKDASSDMGSRPAAIIGDFENPRKDGERTSPRRPGPALCSPAHESGADRSDPQRQRGPR
jgi:CO/xanthine dehydrogenase Mo-binding subunit